MAWSWRWAMVLFVAALLGSSAASASIQRYTDKEGTLHITNVGPGNQGKAGPPARPAPLPPPAPVEPQAPPTSQAPQEPQAVQEPQAPEEPTPPPLTTPTEPQTSPEQLGTNAGQPVLRLRDRGDPAQSPSREMEVSPPPAPAAPPLRQVSLYGGDNPGGTSPRASPARQTPAPSEGPIIRYRDTRGVIHITNVAPAGPAASPAPVMEARGRPATGGLVRENPPEFRSGGTGLGFRRVSWSPEGPDPPAPRAALALPRPAPVTEGGIRRYRDARGVWHINNAEQAVPPAPPSPLRLASLGRSDLLGRAPPEVRPPPALPGPAGGLRDPPPSPSGRQIVAFRDRTGKLVIRNFVPDENQGRGPPLGAMTAALEPIILEAARSYRLPVALIHALIKAESNFVPWAVSPKGAMGLMQLMPGTATFLGVTDPFCPRQNILAGCRYFRLLLDFFCDSIPLALAAYNAGYQRVIDAGHRIPPIKETQEFVTQVLERFYASIKRGRRQISL